ncbi:Ipp1 [Kluyveromyces lactis]|nr:Ipp1 [Kluyveromyces lactis]
MNQSTSPLTNGSSSPVLLKKWDYRSLYISIYIYVCVIEERYVISSIEQPAG